MSEPTSRILNPTIEIDPDCQVSARYYAPTDSSPEEMGIRFGPGGAVLKMDVETVVRLLGAIAGELMIRDEHQAYRRRIEEARECERTEETIR